MSEWPKAATLTGKRCQCPECFRVFSTEANFDRHRKGSHGVDRHCVLPESVGLMLKETRTGFVYAMPPKEPVNEAVANLHENP